MMDEQSMMQEKLVGCNETVHLQVFARIFALKILPSETAGRNNNRQQSIFSIQPTMNNWTKTKYLYELPFLHWILNFNFSNINLQKKIMSKIQHPSWTGFLKLKLGDCIDLRCSINWNLYG